MSDTDTPNTESSGGTVAARRAFNAGPAEAIAAQLGFPPRCDDAGMSARFAFFADDDHLAVVAGPQEDDHVELALAYAIRHAAGRRLSLALPAGHLNATSQRVPWLRPASRPALYEHHGGYATPRTPLTPEATIQAVVDRIGGHDPATELARATTPPRIASDGGNLAHLIDGLTRDRRLDHAHRRSERSWHYFGQRVLSIKHRRDGTAITAGIHYSGANAPTPIVVAPGSTLDDLDYQQIVADIDHAIDTRRAGEPPIHRPDEHWLQAVIRRHPDLVGIEQPALRELPAWRPRDSPGQWGRGFIDLIGLDGHGDIRIVETKLAQNPDDLLILQGLDYLVWATAYQQALRDRLGAPNAAHLELHYVVGASATDHTIKISPCTKPLADSLDERRVSWRSQTVRHWFTDPDTTDRVVTAVCAPGEIPATTKTREHSSNTERGLFVVDRRPPPDEFVDTDRAQHLFGEQSEWGYAIPWTHQALNAPRAHRPMPAPPGPGDDPLAGAVGYWSALFHLLVYGFGWPRPDLGLHWWYEAGKPTDDPKFALIDHVWACDGQLDAFAAWLWTADLSDLLPRTQPTGDRPRATPDAIWLQTVAQQITDARIPSPYQPSNGTDPLHLSSHIGGPLETTDAEHQIHISADRAAAVLITDSMAGWYRHLLDTAVAHPGLESVEVIARPVGRLGTYQRSPVTGLWYDGPHDHHLHGC